MKNYSLVFLLMLVSYSIYSQTTTILPSDTLIEYTGRIDFSNPDAPGFSYSGASVRAAFSGTSISVILDDESGDNFYNFILDGTVLPKIDANQGSMTYQVAMELKDTIHEIEIFKLTEEMFGKTSFKGFLIDEGNTLSGLTNVRERMIEFIGNSITCGYGNEGVSPQTFGPTTENHYLTYAAITSRNLSARHLAVCKSGIGFYRNWDGPPEGNVDCMPNYYSRIYLYDEEPKYNFEEQPDLICINLGTNDFSTFGGDSAKYVSAALNFIDTLQTKYNMPDIICLAGSMLTGEVLENVKTYLQFVADSSGNKGKGNVYFFEMSAQTGDLGIGIDWHPTVKQQLENATELTNYISLLKGWDITPHAELAEVITDNQVDVYFNTGIKDAVGEFQGFSLVVNEIANEITEISIDPENSQLLHIYCTDTIKANAVVLVSYKPGSIESVGDVSLQAFTNLIAKNPLEDINISSQEFQLDDERFTLFPNPTSEGVFSYFIGNDNLLKSATINIYNLEGRNLLAFQPKAAEGSIDLSQLTNSGDLLLVNLDVGNGSYTHKLVIQ